MAEGFNLTDTHIDTIREELSNQLIQIERRNIESAKAEKKNTILASSLSDDDMDDSLPEYAERMDVVAKETNDLCRRMKDLLEDEGPDFPKSKIHALHSAIESFSTELKNNTLLNIKSNQQKKAIENKINFLEVQKKSLEKATEGIKKRSAEVEEEDKKAELYLQKVRKEFAESRKDLEMRFILFVFDFMLHQHFIIKKLFPEDDDRMRNLLADLTKIHFSNDDERRWLDSQMYSSQHVELLLRFGMAERNPETPNLIAFTV